MRLPEQMAGFTVGNMCHRAGIQDIDISLVRRWHQFIPCFNQLSSERLGLCLIELTAQAIEGNLYLFYSTHPKCHYTDQLASGQS